MFLICICRKRLPGEQEKLACRVYFLDWWYDDSIIMDTSHLATAVDSHDLARWEEQHPLRDQVRPLGAPAGEMGRA